MTAFEETVAAYANAGAASLYLVRVEPGAAADIAAAAQYFWRAAHIEEMGPAQALWELFRNARYRVASTLLPFDAPSLGLGQLFEELKEVGEVLNPGSTSRSACAAGIAGIAAVLEHRENPIADEVLTYLADVPAEQRLVVIRGSRSVDATADHLAERGVPARVIADGALRTAPAVELMVCVGPPHFFPEASLTASRAETACFVYYPFDYKKPQEGGLFGRRGGLRTPELRESGSIFSLPDVEPFEPDDAVKDAAERAVEGAAAELPLGAEAAELVEAVMFALPDGWAVWAETNGAHVECIELEPPSPPSIERRNALDVAPGDFVVLREGDAEPDFIRDIADRKFGAAVHRGAQREWKAKLRAAVERVDGVAAAEDRLRSYGCQARNVGYWIGNKCISPRLRGDFAAVCRFSGIEAERETEIWQQLQRIRSAHSSAGFFVRSELEAKIGPAGVEELLAKGYQEYEIEGFGRLAAYRVLHASRNRQLVAVSRIDRPELVKEDGWPG